MATENGGMHGHLFLKNRRRLSWRMALQYFSKPLRRHWEKGHRAGNADGVVDCGGDRRADTVDPGLAGALESERVERARRVLGNDDFDRRDVTGGRQKVIGKGDAERLASRIVDELLEESAAQPLREAPGDLAFDQLR